MKVPQSILMLSIWVLGAVAILAAISVILLSPSKQSVVHEGGEVIVEGIDQQIAEVVSVSEKGRTEIQALVKALDEADRTVTIMLEPGSEYVLPISEDTVIRRHILYNEDAGRIVHSEELNIADIISSSTVTLFTETPIEENIIVFPKLKEISLGEFASQDVRPLSSFANVAIPAVVKDINISKGTITYEIAPPFSREITLLETLINDTSFFMVTNPTRAQIKHARSAVFFGDIHAGDVVVLISKRSDLFDSAEPAIRPFEVVRIKQ